MLGALKWNFDTFLAPLMCSKATGLVQRRSAWVICSSLLDWFAVKEKLVETKVLSAQDCPKDGRPKSGAPVTFSWQGDGYNICSHLCKASSDISEQMHTIGGYLPAGSFRGQSLKRIFQKRDQLSLCRTTQLATASSLTHVLQRPKTSKHSSNSASTGSEERSSPATQKFLSCKDSDVCVGGVLYMEDGVHFMYSEAMHKRLAMKAPQRIERVDCNMPWTANCIKMHAKESLASIYDVPLDRIKGGRGAECSMDTSEAKAIMHHSNASSKRDIYEDHYNGLMPFDSVVTSGLITPLAMNGGFSIRAFPSHE